MSAPVTEYPGYEAICPWHHRQPFGGIEQSPLLISRRDALYQSWAPAFQARPIPRPRRRRWAGRPAAPRRRRCPRSSAMSVGPVMEGGYLRMAWSNSCRNDKLKNKTASAGHLHVAGDRGTPLSIEPRDCAEPPLVRPGQVSAENVPSGAKSAVCAVSPLATDLVGIRAVIGTRWIARPHRPIVVR